MSTHGKAVSTATATVPSINYAEAAQERIQELRRWREQIPHFITPETTDATKRLSSAASVPAAFIELTNLALANHMPLVRAEGATPAQVRDLVAYAEAFGPLADELEALAHFMRYSATAARNAAGNEALTTYALATRLAKRPATAYLAPHVADMRRALGRGRKPSPELLAQRAADRATKAAARAARKALPAPDPVPQE
ncbi:MAG TPA: hypothetical protein VEO54_30430 [Thermoanaerobaculia bacterium]|nr:hypothetical protein [Thermoanaerobaculia bacterium]